MTCESLTLIYMSGTGNSLRVAKWMAEAAEARGAAARLVQFNDLTPADLPAGKPGTMLGLVFPTHGFTAPWAMIRLALRMPRVRRTGAFVAATRAGTKFGPVFLPGMEGTACYLLALILALKGCSVRGVAGFDMPSNWTAAHPGFSPASARAIAGRTRPTALAFIDTILGGGRRFGAASCVCLLLGILLLPVSLGYLLMARFVLAKLFFASNRCTGCGLCAASCPSHGVRMWGRKRPRPYWTYSCESCMRCMSFCPEQAVEAGHSWAVVLYFITTIPVGWWILQRLQLPFNFPAELASYLWFLASLFLAYLLFTLLLRVRPINAFFAYTTFTRIFRRYREPDTTLKDLTSCDAPRDSRKDSQ